MWDELSLPGLSRREERRRHLHHSENHGNATRLCDTLLVVGVVDRDDTPIPSDSDELNVRVKVLYGAMSAEEEEHPLFSPEDLPS